MLPLDKIKHVSDTVFKVSEDWWYDKKIVTSHRLRIAVMNRSARYGHLMRVVFVCLVWLNPATVAYATTMTIPATGGLSSDESGFADGSKLSGNMVGQPEESITNPLFLKEYRKGFREGRDSIRNKMKREKNEKN